MANGTGLENPDPYGSREFESHLLRHVECGKLGMVQNVGVWVL